MEVVIRFISFSSPHLENISYHHDCIQIAKSLLILATTLCTNYHADQEDLYNNLMGHL